MRGRFPESLGDLVGEWIEKNCCHGPGDVYGREVTLTDEEMAFLREAYRIDPQTGRRVVDQVTYSRRKGTRKSELGAWLVCAETQGPVRAWMTPDGPVAGPPENPSVLCVATTEEQGDLVYGAFREIVRASPSLESKYDVGLEVTRMTSQLGEVKLSQSGNWSALDGARPTFQVADEGHLWTGKLRETYAVLRRNLRKRRAAQPWIFMPTTAWNIGDGSIAETHHDRALKQIERVLFDHRQASAHWDLDDPEQLRAAVVEAGGDAHWSDTEAIIAEWSDPEVRESEFRRYWLNQPTSTESMWMDMAAFYELAEPDRQVAAGEKVVLGFDGSWKADATILVGCTLDGHVFEVGVWERPEGNREWHVPRGQVDATVAEAMDRWDVLELACDPFGWHAEIDNWADLYGERVVLFETNQHKRMGAASERFRAAVQSGDLSWSGATLARHVSNCAVKTTRFGDLPVKDTYSRKIDAAVAAVIAYDRASWWASNVQPAPTIMFL